MRSIRLSSLGDPFNPTRVEELAQDKRAAAATSARSSRGLAPLTRPLQMAMLSTKRMTSELAKGQRGLQDCQCFKRGDLRAAAEPGVAPLGSLQPSPAPVLNLA